ncbi:L-lactate permease, partial [Escherichia coli]|nr:L-lactate permease [Escherichia coli]
MHQYLLFLLGLTPLLTMIILILKVKMPIHYAVLSTLFITLILATLFWHTPVQDLG